MKQAITHLVLILIICGAFSVSADEEGRKSLKREYDCVVVTGELCGMTGEPIGHYGLFAFQKDKLVPIPFQIDEKDKDGKFVLTNGKDKSKDDDNGLFDQNDDLVFMAVDTGDRISGKNILPEKYKTCAEIKVIDPVSKEHAWVYFMSFDTPKEKSPVDYVSYSQDTLSFSTRYYSGAYNKKFLAGPSMYTFEKGLGGNSEDLIDRVKVRVYIKSLGVKINRSEEDVIVEEKGYIDGPVRVIVHTKNTTPLVFGIPVSSTEQYIYYYDSYADFAFAVAFPIRPGYFRVTILDDFKDARGWTFYNSNNPSGLVIDGKMDDKEDKQFDRSPWTWSVLTKDEQSFWSFYLAPPGCPVKASLYFNDDAEAQDKMEDNKGELPAIGYDFNIGWKELKERLVEFRLIHFFTRGYQKGMEMDVRNVYDAPLEVASTLL